MPGRGRQLAEATRRRLSHLCRLRQGPDGKWETNERKALARRARKTSRRLTELFGNQASEKNADEALQMAKAQKLAAKLKVAEELSDSDLRRLKGLRVTPLLLKKTMISREVRAASIRIRAFAPAARRLLADWRKAYRAACSQGRARATPETPQKRSRQSSSAVTPSPTPSPPKRPEVTVVGDCGTEATKASMKTPRLKPPKQTRITAFLRGP